MSSQSIALNQKGGNASFPGMLFISILGHVAFLVLALVAPQLFTGKRHVYSAAPGGGLEVIGTVDFRMGQAAPRKIEEQPAPAKTISKANQEPDLLSKTTLPDEKKKPKDEPTAKSTLNQPERKKDGQFGEGKNLAPDAKTATSAGNGKFGLGTFNGPGGSGSGTGTGTPFPFPWYIENVLSKIELNWVKPYVQDTSPQNYVAVVYFVITRVGEVQDVKVEQSSGITALDRSAETAILGATPFPPLPSQWTEPDLAFRVTFAYKR